MKRKVAGGKKRLLSFKELVEEYGCTDWFWRSRYWEREFQAVKMGKGKLVFDRNDIEAFITRQKAFA